MFLDDSGHKLSKRNMETNVSDLHHLESMTFWSVLTSLGTSLNQIFSINPQDYIDHFDLTKFSTSKQKFSYDILQKTNKKIFHLKNKPSDIPENLWNLLKDNANDILDLKHMIQNMETFCKSNSELKNLILNNNSMEDTKV